ncbi:hypothetical protein J3A83DRAFT_4184576 [Scleroderma citrinum]
MTETEWFGYQGDQDELRKGYASRTLYLTINLDDLDRILCSGLKLTKDAMVLELNGAGMDKALVHAVEKWSVPSHFLLPAWLKGVLVTGAWNMAYKKYVDWHGKQKKKLYNKTGHHSQTSWGQD